MDRPCDVCGTVYVARRPASRYCSPLCRQRAKRSGTNAPAVESAAEPVTEDGPGRVEAAVLRDLEAAGRVGSVAGEAALTLARRMDNPRSETGSMLSSLARQLEASVDRATANSRTKASPLDEAQDEVARRRSMRGA